MPRIVAQLARGLSPLGGVVGRRAVYRGVARKREGAELPQARERFGCVLANSITALRKWFAFLWREAIPTGTRPHF